MKSAMEFGKMVQHLMDECNDSLYRDDDYMRLIRRRDELMERLTAFVPHEQRAVITEPLEELMDQIQSITEESIYKKGMKDGINLIKYLD